MPAGEFMGFIKMDQVVSLKNPLKEVCHSYLRFNSDHTFILIINFFILLNCFHELLS